jgi:acyl transferase domain-containing protein
MSRSNSHDVLNDIAIIGMSGRFPKARNITEFWQNLRDGVECISFFSEQELQAAGVNPALLDEPDYVNAAGVLDDIELFDASFFGFNPREAEIMDPQHRFFLECAWESLENAGYDPERYRGAIGIFGGASENYYKPNLLSNPDIVALMGGFQMSIANEKDFMTTRVSYKLNLRGPSLAIQTTCSTSLVSVCVACQSLLNYHCDIALAGGVSIGIPQTTGYFYQVGGILSPDGHCRAFDAEAKGTVGGNGVGIVVLKRLADALADGDCIRAVIKGSAINNDGSLKIGYTAPSVDGQAEVIAMAQAAAGIDPETISYIEAHGTATPLGDPIEIAALTQAFRARTEKKNYCAIGSVKTNVGHLDTAAGVTGLIKTVMALEHELLPPSLHFKSPNPEIDFANSPFYVNAALAEWKANGTPRRAGVSSYGVGGTNAHVIVEEAPAVEPSGPSRPWQLLMLSAKTPSALENATANLAQHLQHHQELNLADVAYTLQVGRGVFSQRRMVVCKDLDDAVESLKTVDRKRVFTATEEPRERPVVFMFPGQGAQYVNMAADLYREEPSFREQVDICSELLKPHLGLDLRSLLYPDDETTTEDAAQQLNQTIIAQPALFVIEYALARLWISWGVRPAAMVGHSIGEYVAACVAGVFSLEDALGLVATRGRLMQSLPGGAMLSVPLSEKELRPLLSEKLSLAAINGPSMCVVSGTEEEVEQLATRLAQKDVACRRLHTSHAFHSEMMEPVLESFTRQVKKIKLSPPQIPYLSNVNGTWITEAVATDASYWSKQLRQTVRFAENLEEVLKDPEQVLLEVGPGQTLSTFARQQAQRQTSTPVVLNSLRSPQERRSDVSFLLSTLGRLWLSGSQIDWPSFYEHERRRRVPLPSYPFERERYWVELQQQTSDSVAQRRASSGKKREIADWFYLPSWKRTPPPTLFRPREQNSGWLVLSDDCGVGSKLVSRLQEEGLDVINVVAGREFARLSEGVYAMNPGERDDYDALLGELRAIDKVPQTIVHLWTLTPDAQASGSERFGKIQDKGFYSLLFLAQALGAQNMIAPLQIGVVSNQLQEVMGQEPLCPEKATLIGPCKVIPQEYPNITCRSIDVVTPTSGTLEDGLVDNLIAELMAEPSDLMVAYRGAHRWVQTFEAVRLGEAAKPAPQLREEGVYLITGGLGDIGLLFAEHLAQSVRAKLVLVGRSAFPENDGWDEWLATHGESDKVSRKIRRLQALQEMGAEVVVESADVAERKQMQAVIKRTYERFGGLHGVIHGAGILSDDSFRAIQEIGRTECEQQFQPKVYGLLVLEEVLRGKELDFCLLLSSVSAVLGGLGFVAYAAANVFMDAFADRMRQTDSVPWLSVNWDAWQFAEEGQNGNRASTLAQLAILPKEGREAFERVLSVSALPRVVVSTGDLQARIDQWIKLESLQDTDEAPPEEPARLHARPSLSSLYEAPRNEVEQKIAAVWQKLLGIERVGIYDNFFELGGHSLLAIQLISRLRDAFQVELSVHKLFDAPTIADLAENIQQHGPTAIDEVDKIAQMLQLVEQLSDSEVKARLAESGGLIK